LNWIDRSVAWLAPQAGLRRARARLALQAVERFAYEGAKSGRRTSGWTTRGSDANSEIGSGLSSLRDRARDLVRNNPHAARGVMELAGAQIGTGIIPRADTGDKNLDKLIDGEFSRWAERCDADGQLDFYGVQWQVVKAVPESGEALVRFKISRPSSEIRVPLQLQVLESDFLDHTRTIQTETGGYILQGVEFDKSGQRKAYWLWTTHPGSVLPISPRLLSQPVPATDVLHVYKKDRPGQVRGASWFAPVIMKLRDLDEYEDAELIRKKIEACVVAFIESPEGADAAGLGKPKTDSSGRKVESFEPGMIERLSPGEKATFNSPQATGGYRDFRTPQLQAIAAGLGPTYEQLSGDFSNVNYSSFRGARLGFNTVVEQYRWLCLIPMFLLPVWRKFIDMAYLAGVIPEPNYGVRWTAPKLESVDPLKDALAERQRLRNLTLTLPEAIAEHGYDPASQLEEIAETNKTLDELGLISDGDPRKVTAAGVGQTVALAAEKGHLLDASH